MMIILFAKISIIRVKELQKDRIHVKNTLEVTTFFSSSPHKKIRRLSRRDLECRACSRDYREYSRENYPFDLDLFFVPTTATTRGFFLVEARNDNCYQEAGRRRSRQPPFSPSFPAIYSLLICFCFFVKTLNPSSFESLTAPTTTTRVPSFPSRVSRETIHLTFCPHSLFNLFFSLSLHLSSILV